MIFIYIFILLTLEIKNECPKENPIKKDGICKNEYCSEYEFQNGNCIISNTVIKTQWLNKLIYFGDNDIDIFEVIKMPNNDIFLLASNYIVGYLYIYGLKSSGETYFNENGNFKEIIISPEEDLYIIIGAGLIINNYSYIFICGVGDEEILCKLIDFEKNNIVYNQNICNYFDSSDTCDFYVLSTIFTILNLNQKSKILLSYIEYNTIDLSIINLTKEDLFSYEIIDNSKETYNSYSIQYNEISCFITENNFVECLVANENKIKVEIYGNSLNHLNSIILDNINRISIRIRVALCIHLKSEIGVFAYYTKENTQSNFSPLYIQIKELYLRESNYDLKNVIKDQNIFEISLYANYTDHIFVDITKSFLIKISDNQFSYAYLNDYYYNEIIIIVIFDLYGTKKDFLFIRYYKIDLSLYDISYQNSLRLFIFNSFLGLGFCGNIISESNYDNGDIYKGIFTIFGYSSKKQITYIDLEIYKNNQGFILDLNNYFSIDNNLFGYELDIKITSIPNKLQEIRFFSIKENKELRVNDIINVNDKILFDLFGVKIQIGENYIIEITSIISTPEYNNFIKFYDKTDKYGENFENYYQRKIMEEKKFQVKLHFSCHDQSIKTCNYPELSTKIIQNNSINIIYFSNFNYIGESNNLLKIYSRITNFNDNDYCNNDIIDKYQYNYMNECMNECPSCYSFDSSKNCIFNCNQLHQYLFNSKYYNNCPEGTIEDSKNEEKICKCKNLFYVDQNLNNICLASLICDDNHPILNDKTNECLNYRVKYVNNYYMECPENTCISQKYWELKICEEKTSNMRVFNGICFDNYSKIIDNIEDMAKYHIKISDNEEIVISAYSYNNDYLNNFEELIQENNNVTIIDLREYIEEYKKINKIDEKTDIYIVIIDTPRIYSNETTNRFNFELYFDNKTKINIGDNNIKKKVYSPIVNEKLLNVELINYFNEQGYNIFNKNDKFYTDVCSGAYIDNNDITLNDRYIDIYPHDIQICPKDCECTGVNLTTKMFICDCDIKENNEYEYELMNKDEILNYFKDFNNIVEYFFDLFNYKIIKCYKLLLDLNIYINNFGFYLGSSFFILSLSFLILFRTFGFKAIRLDLYNNYLSLKKTINLGNSENMADNIEEKEDKKNIIVKIQNNNNSKYEKTDSDINDYYEDTNNYNITSRRDIKKSYTSRKYLRKNNDTSYYERIKNKKKTENNFIRKGYSIKINKENENMQIINNLSFFYKKNEEEENKNFFKIYLSIISDKIDIIQIIFCPQEYTNRFLLFNLFLLNLFIDLLMNCLLYNDYAISQKYHKNGTLDFITSLIISLLSNIFTSILIYFINFLTNYPNFIEAIIKEIKKEYHYFNIILKLFMVIKCKFFFLFCLEILLGLFIIYYLIVFSIINSKSINSFLYNFGLSQIDSLIYSICVSFIISILKRISLLFNNQRLYLISEYFNDLL